MRGRKLTREERNERDYGDYLFKALRMLRRGKTPEQAMLSTIELYRQGFEHRRVGALTRAMEVAFREAMDKGART